MRDGLQVGGEVIVLTWLDRARRDVLVVHPRGDQARPQTGVFDTRLPDRPQPVGLAWLTLAAIDGTRVRVRHLTALDGTHRGGEASAEGRWRWVISPRRHASRCRRAGRTRRKEPAR